MKQIMILGVVTSCLSICASASTWYVDDDNYGKPNLDGKTELSAFGSIKDALENADLMPNDTIMVLPGVYSNDTMHVQGNCRIAINKTVNLISRDGKDVTHIVGEPDPATKTFGANAIRCIGVSHLANNTVIRGFTIRDGYTDNVAEGPGRGGAVYVNNDSTWIVDCVISNCVSSRGAMFQGTAVRTWFTKNRASSDLNYSVGYTAKYHTCLLSDNGHPSRYHSSGGAAVNTTFALNATNVHGIAGSSSDRMELYNCVLLPAEKYSYIDSKDSSVSEYCLIAPALNDFRVKAGSSADGTGNRKWLDGNETGIHLPPNEPLLDLYGNPYPELGPIHKGCVQETVEAKGGLVKLDSRCYIEGYPIHHNASYLYPIQYPCQYRVLTNIKEDERVTSYNIFPASRNWRLPEADEGFTFMPPPLSGGQSSELTIAPKTTVTTIHVATPQNGGSDSNGNGSKDTPFATIQKAVDSAADNVDTLILVGPGTYGEGEAHYPKDVNGNEVVIYGKASVTVHEKKRVRILANEGPENTVLLGAADSEYANESTLPGCGPNAAKCIIFLKGDVGNGIQGFTLTGGHSTRAVDTNIEGDKSIYGGAWYSVSGYACIADCIVSNNVAHTFAAGSAGVLDRLYVTQNHGSGTVGTHPLFASSCLFVDNPSAQSSYGVIGGDSRAYNCTIYESNQNAAAAYNIYSARIYNSIIVGGKTVGNATELGNTILWGQPSLPTSKGYVYGDPNLVNDAIGDYRVKSFSPATRIWGAIDSLYYQHTSADFYGNRIVAENGKATVGAFAETVDASELYIKADNGGVSVIGGTVGLNTVSDQNITLKPAVGSRPCIGFLVNGATNLLVDLPDGELVVTPQQVTAAGGISVEALYDNNWYVDAENGNDENPGFSILPKKTLSAAMSMAAFGDVVNAAPGDYNEGLMGQTETCMISSRVVVASGVILKSTHGPEVTFISGADATINPVTTGKFIGCGTNAVRCVYLNADAQIHGFTLRNGRFRGDSPDGDETRSGGVIGKDVNTSIVYDCIITNCYGYRGGALYTANAIKCRITGCKGASGTIGRIVNLTGCVIDNVDVGIAYPRGNISNCTFLPTCAASLSEAFEAKYPVCNSIIAAPISASESKPVVLNNCVILEGMISDKVAPYVTLTDCIVTNLEAVALLADGSISATSCAIDFGSASYISQKLSDIDIIGSQRIYNGRVDAGAYEFDWRGKYADTILPKRCMVVKASSEVVQGEAKVLVTGTLDTEIVGPGTGRRYLVEIPVKVTGTGTLTVEKGDETVAVFTATDGAQLFTYKSMNNSETFSFVYTPGESDNGCAEIGQGKINSFAFTVILR